MINWLVFNTNFSSILAISWREHSLYINLDNYKTLRSNTVV
jgi:hypothetical protein